MKRFVVAVTVAAAALAFSAIAGGQPGGQVCPELDSGKIDTTGEPVSITITAPDGFLISGYCVKSGSPQSGDGPVLVSVNPPAKEVTITYPSGKVISHYSYSLVPDQGGTSTGGDTTGGDTTGGDTTGGDTTGGDTGGTTGTDTTTGGGTTGGGTTGTGGALGSTTGGSGNTSGELPFTGLPIWIPVLLAGALLASGAFLLRRKRDAF
jgi:hypothetical protein